MQQFQRAVLSLQGLSIGDAFGECFFFAPDLVYKLIRAGVIPGPPFDEQLVEEFMMFQVCQLREVPALPPWKYTDDSALAYALVDHLRQFSRVESNELAGRFGDEFLRDPRRGYGAGMHSLLPELAVGGDWRDLSKRLFDGGSYGNGAAMRVAPLGAYFADDLDAVIENARRSAEITHAHEEGICGAIAVALGAALAWQNREVLQSGGQVLAGDWLENIAQLLPASVVRSEIEVARDLPDCTEIGVAEVVENLGNGADENAQDTVPFVLWAAAQHLGNYEEALWLTVSALGDRDTTCAMVGGIVALSSQTPIPQLWIDSCEKLPEL